MQAFYVEGDIQQGLMPKAFANSAGLNAEGIR